jgi:hypothetical protein
VLLPTTRAAIEFSRGCPAAALEELSGGGLKRAVAG